MLIHIPYMEHTVWDILYLHLSPSTTLPGRPFCFCCSQRVQRGNWPGGPWLWSIKNWGWWICPCTMFCSYKKLKPWTPTEHSFWIQHVCFSHRGENHSHKNKQTNALYSYTTYHNFWSSVVFKAGRQGRSGTPKQQASKIPACPETMENHHQKCVYYYHVGKLNA